MLQWCKLAVVQVTKPALLCRPFLYRQTSSMFSKPAAVVRPGLTRGGKQTRL